jgi:hypothetical protein
MNISFGGRRKDIYSSRRSKTSQRKTPCVCKLGFETLDDRRMLDNTVDCEDRWTSPQLSFSFSNLLNGTLNITDVPAHERNAAMVNAVIEATSIWSAVAPLKFIRMVDSGPLPDDDDDDYGEANHSLLRWGLHDINDPNKVAHAHVPDSQDGLSGDIHDDTHDFNNAPKPWPINMFLEAAAHELGHAIGMEHPNGDIEDGVPPPPFPAIMHAQLRVVDAIAETQLANV